MCSNHRSTRYRTSPSKHWITQVNQLQTVLFHRGQIPQEPRKQMPTYLVRPPLPRTMQAVVDKWLAIRRLTDRPATVVRLERALRGLSSWLCTHEPGIRSFAEVDREHVLRYLTALALCLPFGLTVLELTPQAPFLASGLIDQIAIAGGGYPYLTVNAYNAWAVVPSDLGISLANGGQWVCDATAVPADRCGAGVVQFGAIPAVAVGAGVLILAILTGLWAIWRRPDRLTILVALAVIALAFFAAPTRVHERYGFPFFALGAILFAVSPRWRIAYVILASATFAPCLAMKSSDAR